MSIIQRSGPFSGELEVVLMDDGTHAEDYDRIVVRDKMVFTCKPLEAVRDLAIEQHGAAAILSDWIAESSVRERWDLPDALQYTSFWWTGHEKRVFGFVLSPREGERLRTLIRSENSAGRTVCVRADVKARFYEGAMEVITALLPGESEEEIMMVGHLCHPAPGGNDNASGAAATMEAARTLQGLIEQGKLPKPKRSIRFLWMPEMSGTYAYLAQRESELGRMVAGVNMDMVGENQEECHSSFLIDLPPESAASFAGDLMEAIRAEIVQEASSFASTGQYALFRYATTQFGGGSDQYIFSDPSVGIPMPLLIQEPDKFYHTSADTIEKVDPRMLGIIGSVATTYAFWLASASDEDVRRLGELMLSKAKQRVLQTIQDALTSGDEKAMRQLAQQVAYRTSREQAAFESLHRLSPSLDVANWQEAIADFAMRENPSLGPASEPKSDFTLWEERAMGLTPLRTFKGPIALRGHLGALKLEQRLAYREIIDKSHGNLATLAVYWTDGKRNLLEIADLVEMESGQRDVEYLVRYFEFLGELGLMRMLGAS
jgi:aminopeptidase-like protein